MKKGTSYIFMIILITLTISNALADEWNGFSWSYKNNTLTINGQGEIPAGGPWESNCKNAKKLEVGEDITDLSNLPEMNSVTSIVFHNDYTSCSVPLHRNEKITEIEYTSGNPYFDGSILWLSRLKKIVFDNPNADYVLEDNMLFSKDHTILYYYFDSGKGNVIVPEGVEIIASSAFANSKVKSVTLPASLTTIRAYAFFECKQLKSITLPEKTRFVGYLAFNGCSLNKIDFLGSQIEFNVPYEETGYSDYVNRYGEFAFGYTNLKEIALPMCTYIPHGLFYGCTNLEKVTFGDGSELQEGNRYCPFEQCKKLKSIYIPDSMVINYEFVKDLPSKCAILCHEGSSAEEIAKLYQINYEIIE